ncbi:phospholipase A2 inhibitor NAI-like [Eublepharis macularius]|uniref:Phospholipase A2 inhibitor NAI-like n=1 Tax=Eublepharis macularius TaxID=481883 RepID=A0AA97LGA8_EUBMA|nr:phospholipase A2 inhibitor NAI-like [Eublepharis macularius]XP_054855018.1 phospholipase A2 inhibitor NAI-like [Eublepharis macularius]
MKTLLGPFIAFGLAAMGSSLKCEVCTGIGTNCSGNTMPCEADEDVCVTTIAQNSVAGFLMQMVVKNCGSLDTCRYGPKYMNFGQGKIIQSSVSCCEGDACQTEIPLMPPANTEPNGNQCPACYALSSTSCPDETVDCLGSEDHCLDMETRVTYGNVVLNSIQKGCVSKSVCDDLKIGDTEITGGTASATILKSECKPATIKS